MIKTLNKIIRNDQYFFVVMQTDFCNVEAEHDGNYNFVNAGKISICLFAG